MTEQTIFTEALERPVDQREAFLDAACGSDAALRQRVVALLLAHVALARGDIDEKQHNDAAAECSEKMATIEPEVVHRSGMKLVALRFDGVIEEIGRLHLAPPFCMAAAACLMAPTIR